MTDAPAGSVLHFSPTETARFGLRVFRGAVATIDAAALADEIERERIDVAILRVPAREIGSLHTLSQHGFAPIVADTLVFYDIDLGTRHPPAGADTSVRLRAATPDDADLLARMARTIFADYVSHYHANPLFARDQTLDGYAEWAARHVAADDGSAAWLVERAGELAGFSCYRIDPAGGGSAIGVLNGILPAARGRGTYGAMLRAMLDAFAEIRMARFEIATQVHNLAVQRVWTREGLSLQGASNTVHINALREFGRDKPEAENVSSEQRVGARKFGET